MKKRKSVLSILLVFLISTLMTACSSSMSAPNSQTKTGDKKVGKNEKITLTVWDPYTEPDSGIIMDTIIKNYEKDNPNVSIKRNSMKNEDIRNTIKPALTSNKGPDLFMYDSGPGYLGVLAKSGLALDLTKYDQQYRWSSNFPKWVNDLVTINGKRFGIGNEIELIGVYYNKQIFNDLGVEVPKTYEEFLQICEKAKAKGLIPLSFDDKEQWPAFHLESVFYTAVAGKQKIEKVLNKEEGFDQPVFANALDTFQKLIKNGYTSKSPLSVSYDDGNKELFSGKAAMRITGTWLASGAIEQMKDNVGFFLLPSVKPNLPLSAPGGIGSAMVISSKTKYPEEAAKFLNYMFNKESAKVWYEHSKIAPVKIDPDALNIPALSKDIIKMANSPAGLSYNIDVLMPQKVNDVTKNIMQQLIAGKVTGKVVVKEKQRALDEEIKAGNY
ncbi:ABC transporter substrate-binding protein [Fictibacillus enclensis]|uniref:ABC transporter substrate-binding protein n=1 Tax=Fictibacillus enclensis TaxID=1017270 RepID=UPI0024BF341C|nr:extracellular solute-binding protein [Fictibacillus enclensis]WHY74543.1 extracellular solute-binding protein [Fictibacillus enclensis]